MTAAVPRRLLEPAGGLNGALHRPATGPEADPPSIRSIRRESDHSVSAGKYSRRTDFAADLGIRIQQLLARGRGRTLELAVEIRDARLRLAHGEWTALFHSGRMPFSKRQADRLIGISRLAWLNKTNFSQLPRSWSSLHLLAQLDRPVLERLIEQGTVHPGLTLREVRDLVARFNGRKTRVQPDQPGVRRRVERFCEFVRGGCADWSPGQRQWTRDELLLLAHQLETSNGLHPPQSQTEGAPS